MKTLLLFIPLYFYFMYLILLIISSLYAIFIMYKLSKGQLLLPEETKSFTLASYLILFSVALDSYIRLSAYIYTIINYIF